MFDSLADQHKTEPSARDRVMLALMVLLISLVLFAALYFGVQSAA